MYNIHVCVYDRLYIVIWYWGICYFDVKINPSTYIYIFIYYIYIFINIYEAVFRPETRKAKTLRQFETKKKNFLSNPEKSFARYICWLDDIYILCMLIYMLIRWYLYIIYADIYTGKANIGCMSERLASVSIMEAQLRSPLKPTNAAA